MLTVIECRDGFAPQVTFRRALCYMTVLDERCVFKINDENRRSCLDEYLAHPELEAPGYKCVKAKGGNNTYVCIYITMCM